MRARFGGWLIIGFAGVFSAALSRQRHGMATVNAELIREKSVASALARARADHERLSTTSPSAGELERLAADATVLTQARAEVAALREQVAKAELSAEKRPTAEERFAIGNTVSVSHWQNAGMASPQATLETALWAGAGGDVDTFARTIILMGYSRRAAQELLESMPAAMREQYDTPEKLIAFFTIQEVSPGSAQVRQFTPLSGWPAPAAQMQVLFREANGKAKDRNLLFMQSPDGWKIVVTDGVVAKFAAQLKQAPP